jgi:hypothetical protein
MGLNRPRYVAEQLVAGTNDIDIRQLYCGLFSHHGGQH